MLFRHFYYQLKPFLPRHVRIAVRRRVALRRLASCREVWPIKPGTEKPPAGWPGWPGGKQFGLVFTHDVEDLLGLEKVRPLMDLERRLGFRSSFNFIPEAAYRVPQELRAHLVAEGFEVGVHDLYHDGKLYRSRKEFSRRARHINEYLKSWQAVGFRSGFMHHRLDWLHELDIQYDASTFDTDPFEPQPDGVDTIFPFWVSPPSALRPAPPGYVELPYTVPQDFTTFVVLGEQSIDLWKRKLDWVAAHGGMVLIDTHPDYMAFEASLGRAWQYPVSLYRDILEYVRSQYSGAFWHGTPREAAAFVHETRRNETSAPKESPPHRLSSLNHKGKIWIDLDNTPHVPFFEPIIEELQTRGHPVFVTARDAFQVCELADKKGLHYVKVGRHNGKHRFVKFAGLFYRALQLAPVVRREKPTLGVSHGARSQLILSNFTHIPTLLLADYEYAKYPPLMRPSWEMVPQVIPDEVLYCSKDRIHKYPGIKEDVYAWKLNPDSGILDELGVTEADLIVTVRPPATEAHYHNPESEKLFAHFMKRAFRTPAVRVVLLPRNRKQGDFIRSRWPQWFERQKTVIPASALDGLNLIWHSDLVVSGGGTMNREAAALGVPVYSIFRGSIGAVDQHLQQTGQLTLIESPDDVESKIRLEKRVRKPLAQVTSRKTLQHIVDTIEQLVQMPASSR